MNGDWAAKGLYLRAICAGMDEDQSLDRHQYGTISSSDSLLLSSEAHCLRLELEPPRLACCTVGTPAGSASLCVE